MIILPCDLSDGGWRTIIQRIDGSLDFNKTWQEYVDGFGTPDTNYWLGLREMFTLTDSPRLARIYLESFNNTDRVRIAFYRNFAVKKAVLNYRLYAKGYYGDAGNALEKHHAMHFSTFDADHDKANNQSCAQTYGAGWWYRSCYDTLLTGAYEEQDGSAITWDLFTLKPLKKVIVSIL